MTDLSIKNLKKHFGGVKAVDGLSIVFESGKISSVIGPNGSGKSTLVNLLTGVFAIDSGSVFIGEHTGKERLRAFEVAELGITRTFQNVRLFEQMSVLDNLLVVLTERSVLASLFDKHNQYHWNQAKELLAKVGLWEKRNEYALNLSYGQRKLLEIARALAMKSDVYLFDEPFAGLFKGMREILIDILKELRASSKTVVLIEHNMDLIRELSDHVIVMDAGKLLAQGKPEDVLSRKEVLEAYIGS